MLIVIAIIAFAVLLYFNNSVRNRSVDRSNRLAEKQEALMQMLKEKKAREGNAEKAGSDSSLP
jgi:hypothetical protein